MNSTIYEILSIICIICYPVVFVAAIIKEAPTWFIILWYILTYFVIEAGIRTIIRQGG